jgi:hypothetical protein
MPKIKAICESIQQNARAYTARFVMPIPGAKEVENKLPVKGIFTAQFPGTDNQNFEVNQEYEINISRVKDQAK